jgi:hypothetical protein
MLLPLEPDTARKQLQVVVAVTTTSPSGVVNTVMAPRSVPGLAKLGVLSAMSKVTVLPSQAVAGLHDPIPGGRRHLWVLPGAASLSMPCVHDAGLLVYGCISVIGYLVYPAIRSIFS